MKNAFHKVYGDKQILTAARAIRLFTLPAAALIAASGFLVTAANAATGPAPVTTATATACAALAPAPALPATSPGSTVQATSVQIVVPAVTTVRLGVTGQPAAVETNTGQGPSCADLFFVVDPAGQRQSADLAQVDATMHLAADQAGSWQAGWNPR